MDSREWPAIYQTLRRIDRALPRAGRKCRYTDMQIVAMYLWTVLHDRPLSWAVQRANYGRGFRPRRLPSYSQFKRRLTTVRVNLLLSGVNAALARADEPTAVMFVDGKALPVGPDSTDPDARPGRASGGFARGYKLHALVTRDGRFVDFSVTALNVCEKNEAHSLLQRAPLGALVLGDGYYDDAKLYETALARGTLFLAKPRRNAGQGHRRPSTARCLSLRLWRHGQPPLYELRREIERYFGQLTCFGGGLSPLPAWVRRLPRVTRWITAKLIIYHARLRYRTKAG